MSITDELRKFIEDPLLGYASQDQHIETLTEIADRIDAEYQKAIRELNNLADASVLLPKDADGEYIHIGDVMEWPEDGETFEVIGIGDGWTLFYVIEDGVAEWTRAENKRHHQPDTWERIIEDAIIYATCDTKGNRTRFDALVARCKKLAGETDA